MPQRGEWTLERAHGLLSRGYRVRPARGEASAVEIRATAGAAVLLDLLGVAFWLGMLIAFLALFVHVPGWGESEAGSEPAWVVAAGLVAWAAAWMLAAWSWRELRRRLAPPIRVAEGDRLLASWREVSPWSWLLERADGKPLCRARRRTRLAFLPRRRWLFEADGERLVYEYELKKGPSPPPRVVSERLRVLVEGGRISYTGLEPGLHDPLLPVCLGFFCVEVPHSLL